MRVGGEPDGGVGSGGGAPHHPARPLTGSIPEPVVAVAPTDTLLIAAHFACPYGGTLTQAASGIRFDLFELVRVIRVPDDGRLSAPGRLAVG